MVRKHIFYYEMRYSIYKSNNFTVKMAAKKGYLFCFDLRIYNQIIKLKVYEEDGLEDLINRLAISIKDKQICMERLRSKLEDQFKKVMLKTDLSQTVKSKLASLLDQSKIIIVGIDTDKNQMSLNETPFRILQESTINGKKTTSEQLHKNVQQINRDSSNPNLKSQTEQFTTQNCGKIQHQNTNYNYISRTKNNSPNKVDIQVVKSKDDSSTEIFQKRYQALDRKCQNYISKNIPKSQLLDLKRNPQQYQHNTREGWSNQRRGGYKQLFRQDDLKLRQTGQQNKYLRVLSGNQVNKYGEGLRSGQTFHQYKLNRYKATSTSTQKIPKYQQINQQKYQSRDNRQNLPSCKSITRINNNLNEKGGFAKLYEVSNHAIIRNNDSQFNNKLLAGGTISYKRLKGKFNYLGE